MEQVLIETMRAFPDVTFASINSKVDRIQRVFYTFNLFKFLSATAYYRKLSLQLREFAKQPNFAVYLINGIEHDFTDWHELYSTYTTGPHKHDETPSMRRHEDKMSLLTWIGRMPPQNRSDVIRSHCQGRRVDDIQKLTSKDCDSAVFK